MGTDKPLQRPIKKILVANRGEIAVRILQACRELPSAPVTYALYTSNDYSHVSLGRPSKALEIPSPAMYMDISELLRIVRDNDIDAVHPGYGFLSENPEFAQQMQEQANCMVIGPGWRTLEATGDKLKAKDLATQCGVPVLKAMAAPAQRVDEVEKFANEVGFPIMIKAIDGGGGRGIRLAESNSALQAAVERCVAESPSKTVFAEQAAVNGFKHIEVQIIGDGQGWVKHLWERDCSVQRRFQKIVEVAPTPVSDRTVITKVIGAAMQIAGQISYLGLGTFEFLVNLESGDFYFLEINPRLQVEHTISESIAGIDLVREQLFIAQGLKASTVSFAGTDTQPPGKFSIQFRLCAEDPNSNFSLSAGKITEVRFPHGNGIRVDSHLSQGGTVGSDFDNLLAKIIVTASSWKEVLAKAQRALEDTSVVGVKTNLNLLRAIAADHMFQTGNVDNQWLEKGLQGLIREGDHIGKQINALSDSLPDLEALSGQSSKGAGTSTALRKGDAWSLTVEPGDSPSSIESSNHHLKIDKITRNDFPESLAAVVSHTAPGSQPQNYKIVLESTNSTGAAVSSNHTKGDPNDRSHIVLPMSGKLVEVLVDEGQEVQEGEVVAFIKQMKMELEVRSPRSGVITWVIEMEDEDGDDVEQGALLAKLKDKDSGLKTSKL